MFVVLVHYTAPQSELDGVWVDHYDWVTQHYGSGDFVVTGHQSSGIGGVIIARAMARGKLEAILATDPFELRKLARHEVIEFEALRTVPEMAKYADQLRSTTE